MYCSVDKSHTSGIQATQARAKDGKFIQELFKLINEIYLIFFNVHLLFCSTVGFSYAVILHVTIYL